jgi:hypothetical protein
VIRGQELRRSQERSELTVFRLANELAPTPPHNKSSPGGPSRLTRGGNKTTLRIRDCGRGYRHDRLCPKNPTARTAGSPRRIKLRSAHALVMPKFLIVWNAFR